MTNWWEGVLKCPVCGAAMSREEGSLACNGARRHCYDFAKAGYVNLAPSRSSGGGDDAALIAARTTFLEKGHYAPVAERICALLHSYAKGNVVLDAGCGEGYYSVQMAQKGNWVIGVDLSKRGITHAAKLAARHCSDALFAVAGIFELPVADASLDAVVSLFAPIATQEFLRVLRPGGILIVAAAGEEHLFSLKQVLYDTPYRNTARADAPEDMQLLTSERVRYTFDADRETLDALFAMTPYFYRTPKSGVARLAATERLDVDVDVEIAVYRK